MATRARGREMQMHECTRLWGGVEGEAQENTPAGFQGARELQICFHQRPSGKGVFSPPQLVWAPTCVCCGMFRKLLSRDPMPTNLLGAVAPGVEYAGEREEDQTEALEDTRQHQSSGSWLFIFLTKSGRKRSALPACLHGKDDHS